MPRPCLCFTALVTSFACVPAGAVEGANPVSVYDFEMASIEGQPVKLSTYKGKVLLLVNVASK